MTFSPKVKDRLDALEDVAGRSVFVGRSQSIHRKYGREGALLLGKLVEEDRLGEFVYLDALAPHVILSVGARGSGKSYDLGVIAEEIISKNPNIAIVIIDPIGIYWSMKYPNQEEKEVDELIRMGLTPRGVDEVKVMIPEGVKNNIPSETYDKTYALSPADLTVEEWCLTFDIDRFSPKGLLMEKVMEKVASGWQDNDGKKHEAKEGLYGINDIIDCLQNDSELCSKTKGFKSESRRAIISRFESAKNWGVFAENGTPLVELCKEGEISVVDVSFLEEKVTSLVIGLLSRKILNARKLATRKTSMKKLDVDMEQVLETDIPPTWLFIDEAHTLIPSGSSKTAATDSLIEYVKQGRRPGCSLVFATQQPSAIDTKVLSQLDLLLCHKLVFDDDIKAVFKRMPTQIPKEYSKDRFVKTLPIGYCLLGDRSDHTSRAFTMQIRPRYSQHEGREARSVQFEEGIKPEEVKNILVKMVVKQIKDMHRVHLTKVDQLVRTINKRYKTEIDAEDVVQDVLKHNCVLDGKHLINRRDIEVNGNGDEKEVEVIEQEDLLSFQSTLSKEEAEEKILKKKKSKFFLFGYDEVLKNLELEYWPVYKVEYEYYEKNGFRKSFVFIDGMTGEILSSEKKSLKPTHGLSELINMKPNKRKIVIALRKGKQASAKSLARIINITDDTARINAQELSKEGILKANHDGKATTYSLNLKLDVPASIISPEFTNLESDFVLEKVIGHKTQPIIPAENLEDIPSIFGESKIVNVGFVYRPVYRANLVSKKGNREIVLDGMTGKLLQ